MVEWVKVKEYEEIIYEKAEGIAKVTINRPHKMNAFRTKTIVEMIEAFRDASEDDNIRAVILTGAGDRAFCAGGDVEAEIEWGKGKAPPVEELFRLIRTIPKPVIAMVNGYSIGGGNVLATVCDLTIASENAKLGQIGPKMGSFAGGFGTAYLSRIVGQKKAREIWYLCHQYSAQEAKEMGLVNKVVPPDKLEEETVLWCKEIMLMAPSMIRACKITFNADTDHIYGIADLSAQYVMAYYGTEESEEMHRAILEKRPPDFSKIKK